MSGRIRTVKPELLEDAVTAGLSDTAFRLFIACILLSDDYGCFRAESALLKGQVFWKADPSTPLEYAISELAPLVRFYEVGGQRYGHIRNWEKHQKVQHRGRRHLPSPPEDPHESLMRPSGDPHESLTPDHRPSTIDHRPASGARAPACVATPEPEPTTVVRLTGPPPEELPQRVLDDLAVWADGAGCPPPTREGYALYRAKALESGRPIADPVEGFRGWLIRERGYAAKDRDRARERARMSANSRAPVHEPAPAPYHAPAVMPRDTGPPVRLTPEAAAEALAMVGLGGGPAQPRSALEPPERPVSRPDAKDASQGNLVPAIAKSQKTA